MLNDLDASARRRFPSAGSAADARAGIRRGLDYGAALAAASAVQQRCVLPLTQNLGYGRQLDGVRTVNPLIAGPESLDATP